VENVLRTGDDIKNSGSQFHNAEAVLKSFVSCTRVDEIAQSELMDVPQSLKRGRIDYSTFIRSNGDERVNWIAEFVEMFHRVQWKMANQQFAANSYSA
jgi:hypothetical protein